MAQTNVIDNGKNRSPDIKKQKGSQGQAIPKPRSRRQDKNEQTERKTRTEIERYLAPSDGLTVWNILWKFDDAVGINKTKLSPFTEIFGESDDSMHEALRIRNKTGIPNKNGHIHSVNFWKDLFLEACDKKITFKLSPDDKKQAKVIGIRLALTAPTIFEDFLWTDDHLKAREDTAAWAGAQQVFGTWRWNPEQFINQRNASGDDNKNTQEESKQETNTETSDQTTQPGSESNETEENQTAEVNQEGDTTKKEEKGKHITFEEPTIEPKYRNKLYIQKLSIKKKTTSGPLTQDHGRKHRIFVKWRSPKLTK